MSFFNKHKFIFLFFLCGMVLVLGGCEKQGPAEDKLEYEIDEDYTRGPLTVHVRVSKSAISIADTFFLELEAAIEQGYELTMPQVGEVLTSFGIRDWRNMGEKLDESGNNVTTYRYRLEPFLSGTFSVGGFVFEFTETNTADSEEPKVYSLETEPVEIEVSSLLGEERAELVIADIEGVVELPAERGLWWVWVSAAVVILAGVGLWFKFRRRKLLEIARIFRPAHEVAYERLRRLVAENLVEAGKIKEFYESISGILRHYIEDRFELRAPERTTEEFLFDLQQGGADVLGGQDKAKIGEFLQHCDLVKFARYEPMKEQIQQTFDLVKDFIEKTRSDAHQIDVTEAVQAVSAAEVGGA